MWAILPDLVEALEFDLAVSGYLLLLELALAGGP